MISFYLLYDRESQLSLLLDFQVDHVSITRFPVMETEVRKELIKELKQARMITQKTH